MKLNGMNIGVTGLTGMVGQQLGRKLLEKGANVFGASLDDTNRYIDGCNIQKIDLRYLDECQRFCRGKDIIIHLAGIKGSPSLTQSSPASFFVPTLMFNTNMLEAAVQANVGWILYTSTVGVYGPAETFYEDDLWTQFPSENDKFAGWAKRMGELQIEAYRIQTKRENFSIVRPVNIYGKYDNFNPETSMVVPSLIRRCVNSFDTMEVWGDGSPVRDFINSADVAEGMIFCVENEVKQPVNLGNGTGHTIKELVELIVKNSPNKPAIVWDKSKPSGDKYRVANIDRIKAYGWQPKISLEDGIRETMEWYLDSDNSGKLPRYDEFVRN